MSAAVRSRRQILTSHLPPPPLLPPFNYFFSAPGIANRPQRDNAPAIMKSLAGFAARLYRETKFVSFAPLFGDFHLLN